MRDFTQNVREYYNVIANVYDELYLNEQIPKYKKIIKLIEKWNNRQYIFDLGCGTGEFEKTFLYSFKNIVCIDISDEMLKKAKQKLRKLSNIMTIQADIRHLPLRKQNKSCIITLVTVINTEKFLKKTLIEILAIYNDFKLIITIHKRFKINNYNIIRILNQLNLKYRIIDTDDIKDIIILIEKSKHY